MAPENLAGGRFLQIAITELCNRYTLASGPPLGRRIGAVRNRVLLILGERSGLFRGQRGDTAQCEPAGSAFAVPILQNVRSDAARLHPDAKALQSSIA